MEDSTNLDINMEVKEILQVTCEKITLEKEEEKKCTDKLEKKLTEVYNNILDYVQELEVTAEEKIQNITQKMERYKKEKAELIEKLTPRTLQEVRELRDKEATSHIDSIAHEVKEVSELYDKIVHIWTSLEEDERIQQLDQR